MRILFVNHTYPDTFGPLAACFAANAENEVLFMSSYGRRDYAIPGVRRVVLRVNRDRCVPPDPDALPGVELDRDCTTGRMAFSSYQTLRRTGFVPDMVLSTARRGYALFLREAFPESFLVGYACGRSLSEPGMGMPPPGELVLHLLRSRHVLHSDLYFAFSSLQKNLFPSFMQNVIHLVPYSADTEYFSPEKGEPFCPDDGSPLPSKEIVSIRIAHTAIARDPDLWHVIRGILVARPHCHVVLLCGGGDTRLVLEAIIARMRGSALQRLHLHNFLPLAKYRNLLCATTLHFCPDKSGLPSSEVLEAMSCGALLVLPPDKTLQSILSNGENVFITHATTAQERLQFLLSLLERANAMGKVRKNARKTVLQAFRQQDVLPRHAAFLVKEFQEWKNRQSVL